MAASPFFELLNISNKYRQRALRATIYSVLNKIFDIAPEVLIGVAVDVVVKREQSLLAQFGVTHFMDQLILLAILTFIIWACESVFEYLYSLDWRGLAQLVQHELRIDAYQHIQNLDVAYFEKQHGGRLVSILNDDINQLERFLDGGANALIQVLTAVVVIGGIFFYLAPLVALCAMIPIPIILFGAFSFQKKADPLYAQVREAASVISGQLTANIHGITTIKAEHAESRELQRINAFSGQYLQANSKAIAVSSAFVPVIRMAILAGFIATLVLGGYMTADGRLAVGSYGVLVFLTQRLLWPLTGLAQTVDLYQRAMASTRRVLTLLNTPITVAQGSRILRPEQVQGTVKFHDVAFAYDNRAPIFERFNLTIPAGKTVAFVGATGSGKSTVAKLILRFYDPQSGKVTIDDHDLRSLDLGSLRSMNGFVGQEIHLFADSVRNNIAYGKPEASISEVITAAKIAEAHDFIIALPHGYDTLLGERGQQLSGGQRQRLGIARAVLKNPRILLLDEATSAVDNETERLIQKSLEQLRAGRTVIAIAHRLSTIMAADHIVVLEQGRIVEQGTHATLLALGGIYSRLWHLQTPSE